MDDTMSNEEQAIRMRNFWRGLGREPQFMVGHMVSVFQGLVDAIESGESNEISDAFIRDFKQWRTKP